MMVPNLNSVVFYYKSTTWSCLSGTACSHMCSRTSSCFGAWYRSSFPENLAMPSHRLVLQTFFLLPRLDESEVSVTNQIWISGRYDGWNIPNICILSPACTRHCAILLSSAFSVVVVQDHLQMWTYHGSHPSPMISKNHPLCCLQQGSPHHPS